MCVGCFNAAPCLILAQPRSLGTPTANLALHLQSTKRWWQCEGCKYRFTTVGQKYPSQACAK